MKRNSWLVIGLCILAVTAVAGEKIGDGQAAHNSLIAPPTDARGSEWIDYSAPGGEYGWNGNFYMSNFFRAPDSNWYPFTVTALQIFPSKLDGATTTGVAGVMNRARVFLPGVASAVTMAAEVVNAPANIMSWNTIVLPTAAVVTTGDFIAGMWNSTNDGARQGYANTAIWVGPPVEPFIAVNDGGTTMSSANTAGLITNDYGATYPTTTSAALVRALCDGPTVPVELMRLSVQ